MPYQENGLEFETVDWRRRLLAVGNCSTTTLQIVDRAIKQLKNTGIWPQMRRINFCIGNDLASSLIPQKNTTGSAADTNNNLVSADFNEALGWQCDGSTKYLDTGLTPSSSRGGIFATLMTTQTSDTNGRTLLGAQSLSSTQVFRIIGNRDSAGGVSSGSVEGCWGGANVGPHAALTGGLLAANWHVVRNGSTALNIYKNGTSVASSATNITPATAGNTTYVMCTNANGTAGTFLENATRLAGYSIDAGMAAAQALQLYNIWQQLQIALKRNV